VLEIAFKKEVFMEDLFIGLFANVGVILLLVLILRALKKVD